MSEEVDVVSSRLALWCSCDGAVAAINRRPFDGIKDGLGMHTVNEYVVFEEAAFNRFPQQYLCSLRVSDYHQCVGVGFGCSLQLGEVTDLPAFVADLRCDSAAVALETFGEYASQAFAIGVVDVGRRDCGEAQLSCDVCGYAALERVGHVGAEYVVVVVQCGQRGR